MFFCLEYFHRWSCIRLIRPCFNQFLWYWLFFGGWCGNCDINRYHPSFFWIFPWSHGMGDVQWLRHWLVGWLLVFYDHSESFWIILTKSCKHMENLYENCFFNNTVGCLIILSTTKQPGSIVVLHFTFWLVKSLEGNTNSTPTVLCWKISAIFICFTLFYNFTLKYT